MAVNLRHFDKPKHAQTLFSSTNFQNKNKIVVNNPVQTHFTVQGVQSYTPKQIQAMKIRQDRAFQNKEGSFIAVQTVNLSDKLVNEDIMNEEPVKKVTIKQKERPKSKREFKNNARNAASMNTKNIVKMEKEIEKKDALQRKLQKMSNRYKQFFKGINMKQGITVTKKVEEDVSQYEESVENSPMKIDNTTHPQTKIKRQKEDDERYSDSEFGQNQDDKEKGLNLGFNLIKNYTTYSEKLGSAIDEMFK